MSDAKITPLARRLAEENGIDWRQLPGTGPDGTVVERDILSFLAKVMAGEVSLPPAPEEASMPAGAIANMAQAQAALQKEGVQLGDLLPSGPGFGSPAPASALDDDLDFDIDLDLEEPTLAAEEPISHTPSAFAEPPKQPTVSLAEEPAFSFAEPEPVSTGFEWEPPGSLTPPSHSADFDLPPLPSGVELVPPTMGESPKLVWETTEVLPPPAPHQSAPIQAGMSITNDPVLDEPEVDLDMGHPAREPIFTAPTPMPEPEPMTDMHMEPEPAPMPEPTPAPAPMAQNIVAPAAASLLAAAAMATAGLTHEPAATLESPPPAAPEPAAVTPEAPVTPAAAMVPVTPPAPMPASIPAPVASLLKVQTWQRLVSLEAANQAAQTLSDAWKLKVGLYPLLFRAVDKALADTQTSMRAAKGNLEGEELQTLRVAPSQSLRGVLDSLQMSSNKGEGLAVLSLLDSSFDHVVFPGRSTLILGKALEQHALLSLSGDMDAAHAGNLLEHVAYYLEHPILLV